MNKLLITANTSWFVYNFFRHTLADLAAAGYQITVVAPADDYADKLVAAGFSFQALPISRDGGNVVNELISLRALAAIVRRCQPACILNFTPKLNIYGTTVAKRYGIPCINTVSGMGSLFSERGLKSFVGRRMVRLTHPRADHIVFQNQADQHAYVTGGYVREGSYSLVSGIGLNLAAFPYQAPSDPDCIKFVLVARLLKSKGIYEYIKAAEAVIERAQQAGRASVWPSLQFDLLGFFDTPNPQSISRAKLSQRLNNSPVRYLGQSDDVFECVKDHDCVVLPSYYKEGLPQCLLEAAAMGKPVITTNTPGCRDAVEHGVTGLLVTPRNVDELANAMIKMIEMPLAERQQMGLHAHQKAQNEFCHRKISGHYLQIIKRLTETS